MFKSLMQRYAYRVVAWRWPILILTLLASSFLFIQIFALKFDNNPDLWVPENNEFINTTHKLEKKFGGRNFTVIGILPENKNIYTPEVLQKIENIQRAVEALPEAVKTNIVSLAARRVKDIQGDEEGMIVKDMLGKSPLSEKLAEEVREAIKRNPLYYDLLVSKEGSAAAVVADFTINEEHAEYAPLFQKLDAIAATQRDENTRILLGGQPVEAANLEFAMQKMPLYFGIAFLIIMLVQFLAFRSFQGMLLPVITAILSVIWGLGWLRLAGIHMDALNSTTPILIMAVATGHSIQILKRYYEELDTQIARRPDEAIGVVNRMAVVESLIKVGPVMLTAGTIAALAFFSMCFADVSMLRHFGFFAGTGILSALVIEFTFIPSLRAILPCKLPVKRGPDVADRLLKKMGYMLTQPGASRRVLILCAILIAFVGSGIRNIIVDNSAKQYSPQESQIRKDSKVLNEKFGGTDSIVFLIEGKTSDSMKDPAVLKAMAKLQIFLEQQPGVGKTQSLADLVRRMNMAMHNDDPAWHKVPDNRNLISQYLLLYSLSGQPQDFDNVVDNDYQNGVIWTYLKTDSTAYAQQLWRSAEELIKKEFPASVSVHTGGGLPQTVAVNESLVNTKLTSLMQMAVVVFILSSLILSSFVGGLLVVAPLAAITLVNFGFMGWLAIPLDMGTATTASMVAGIGADYEIYMLYRLREEFRRSGDLDVALRTSLMTSGKAVIFVALSIAGGYTALLFSDFKFYPRLGSTMIATMFISALLSLFLLRAIIYLFKPKFIER